MQDSKFINHLCRIIVTPVQNYACACVLLETSLIGQTAWCYELCVSWTLHWCTWTADLVWKVIFFSLFSCFLEAWKRFLFLWDARLQEVSHWLLCLWSFPLSYIILTVNLRVNMGTNVQKNFFSSARTFNRWFFKHVLFTGKCKEKKSGEGKFFSSFVRQRIVLFWVLVRMKYEKAVTYLLNIVDCQGLSCGERTSNIIMC